MQPLSEPNQDHLNSWLNLGLTSLTFGVLFGLVPLILGFFLKQRRFGLVALILCAVVGFFFGIQGASVSATGISFAIIVRWQRERRAAREVPK
jgi:hypothetical protein